jgi:hypothetical protein
MLKVVLFFNFEIVGAKDYIATLAAPCCDLPMAWLFFALAARRKVVAAREG